MPLVKQDTKDNVIRTFKESSIILVYELIGTFVLTTLVANYCYQLHNKKYVGIDGNPSIVGVIGNRDNVGLLLGMFICIIFSARISGSHFNPAITLSYIIGNVQHGNFDRILGFLYIAMQFGGAVLGAIVSGIFCTNANAYRVITEEGKFDNNILLKPAENVWSQLLLEILGSFFLVFMYLSSTNPKTKFTKDAAI